jgi:uncharacterized membrane protein YphA (DoxX/SURF4 family)
MAATERRGRLREITTDCMARCGVPLLRISLGVIFLWFGVLKFFPGLSPAEQLAGRTISALTLGHVGPELSRPLLAAGECVIGVGLLSGRFLLLTTALLLVQMLGTMAPLVLFRTETFLRFPYAATLLGQYIIKNIVLVAAAVVVGSTADGGGLVTDPELLRGARARRRGRAAPGDVAGGAER